MRIPTNKEYDKLVKLTGGDNAKMHWDRMFSYVDDTDDQYRLPAAYRAYRGYDSAHYWDYYSASYRVAYLGFRPAFDVLNNDALSSGIKEGDTIIIGTLFMNGHPVHVPQHPTWDGDIEDYIPDTTLELREPLEDPQYQMTGIYIGDGVVVADRVVLKIPSHEEILQALSSAGTSSGAASTAESERKTPDQVEFQWILKFVAGQEGERYSSYRHQLQSLWTSFCLRYGLDVDTRRYDDMMRRLFRAVGKLFPAEEPFQFEAFDLFMGEHLS